MTHTELPSAPTRLWLPSKRAVYQLSTDFYPWTEVIIDLERRKSPGWSAILDVQQAERWARYLWINGEDVGGFAPNGSEVAFFAITRGLSNAIVTLYEIESTIAEIVWLCRKEVAKPTPKVWPELAQELGRGKYTGVVIADETSFWKRGRMVGGSMPVTQTSCVLVSPAGDQLAVTMTDFWVTLIHATAQRVSGFSEEWRQTCLDLSMEYAVLDPFDGGVSVIEGKLLLGDDPNWDKLLPALALAYALTLRRVGLDLGEMTQPWQRHMGWVSSGLGDL